MISEKVNELLQYLNETYPEKKYNVKANYEEEKDEYQLTLLQGKIVKLIVKWEEEGFRHAEIQIKNVDSVEDYSMIRGLSFYFRRGSDSANIMFSNHEKFIEFWDIIVVGSFKKIW